MQVARPAAEPREVEQAAGLVGGRTEAVGELGGEVVHLAGGRA